jgi:nucleotide-binding universal stress UspA family protein
VRDADLIVLGEHRRRLLHDIFPGTTVERVMRHGRRPVLMVNQPPAGPYRRLLAATDLSEHSARALRTALRLGLLDQVHLTLLHVFESPGLAALGLSDAPPATHAAQEAEVMRAGSAALARFVSELGLPLHPDQQVAAGDPATVIAGVAARLRPDLLVLGTAGAGFIRRAVMGSVAATVLGAVRCDTLAVPPDVAR